MRAEPDFGIRKPSTSGRTRWRGAAEEEAPPHRPEVIPSAGSASETTGPTARPRRGIDHIVHRTSSATKPNSSLLYYPAVASHACCRQACIHAPLFVDSTHASQSSRKDMHSLQVLFFEAEQRRIQDFLHCCRDDAQEKKQARKTSRQR